MIKKFSFALLLLLPALFGGCLYPNKCGLSNKYYDQKKSYYDSQGNYIEECPDNIVNYGEKSTQGEVVDYWEQAE